MGTEITREAVVAQATPPAPTSYEDLTLEEALACRADALDFVAEYLPRIQEANKVVHDLETMIRLRLEQDGASRFERGEWRGSMKIKKQGSASVYEPKALRSMIEQTALVPAKELDAALPWYQPEPVVKAVLRKVRKLAEFGGAVAKLVTAHITEPTEIEVLVIERVEHNVTGTATEAIEG